MKLKVKRKKFNVIKLVSFIAGAVAAIAAIMAVTVLVKKKIAADKKREEEIEAEIKEIIEKKFAEVEEDEAEESDKSGV